jgi:hypothetical protein
MIIVIPFTGNTAQSGQLADSLLKHGGLGGHRLLVPAATEDYSAAEAFVAKLRSQFVEANIVQTNTPGAPLVKMFRDGLITAAKVKPGQQEIPNHPILWLEPGYVPTKADWADALQSAFFNAGGGQRILGDWEKLPDMIIGNGMARHTVQGGWAPKGPAVFPAQLVNASEMIQRLNAASAPWREVLQFVLTPFKCTSNLLSSESTSLLELVPDEIATVEATVAPTVAPVEEPAEVVAIDETNPTSTTPRRAASRRATTTPSI